jgi:hypothetical protein
MSFIPECLNNQTTPSNDQACCWGTAINTQAGFRNTPLTPIIASIVCLAVAILALAAKLIADLELTRVRESKSTYAIENNCISKKYFYSTMTHFVSNLFIVLIAGAIFAMTLNQPTCCPDWVMSDFRLCENHCLKVASSSTI